MAGALEVIARRPQQRPGEEAVAADGLALEELVVAAVDAEGDADELLGAPQPEEEPPSSSKRASTSASSNPSLLKSNPVTIPVLSTVKV